ncbi:MAG: T9SS type B sorting domain-containing protein [Chitinophagales bacterium]|nr:T9SS type B sorting domain-containing protein [Chitinophagales bacterium]
MAKGLNVILIILLLAFSYSSVKSSETDVSRLEFVENRGQWEEKVLFKAKTSIGYIYLESDRITVNIYDPEEMHHATHHHDASDDVIVHGHAFQMKFNGSNADPLISKKKRSITRYNYFVGQEKGVNTRSYKEIIYENLYPGIDFKVYSSDIDLKYEFIVHPNVDPDVIEMQFIGTDGVQMMERDLLIKTSVADIPDLKPVAWLSRSGRSVKCDYSLSDEILKFNTETYDPNDTLVIDPELIFSTYSGSFSDNFGYTATFDKFGFLYSGSTAFGNNYPTTPGAYQMSFAGGFGAGALPGTDIAISKYDTSGKFMVYSTYLGGSGDEVPHSIVVDDNGELFVLGTTSSANFPFTSGAFDTTFAGGNPVTLNGIGVDYVTGSDIVISRFSANGSNLLASTFVGGVENDGINTAGNLTFNYADELRGEIVVDDQGNVYVASCTQSSDFPVSANAFQTTIGGGFQDACVFKMDRDLTTMIFSSFLGGENNDAAYALFLDDNYDVYLSGGTNSIGFPVTPGSYQTAFAGGSSDGFITKIDNAAFTLLNSSYYGSPNYDQLYFIDLDDHANIHVFGQTNAPDSFFIHNALYSQANSGQLITKFNAVLDSVIWSTVFGSGKGSPDISPTAFLVDVCNKAYISGWGSSGGGLGGSLSTNNLEVSIDAYQGTTDGNDFYLMVLEDDASDMFYATYFGGNQAAEHVDGGTSRFDKKGFIYQSVCAGCGGFDDFPIKPSDAVSPTNNSPNCNNGVFKLDLGLPIVISDFDMPDVACAPANITFTNLSQTQGPGEFLWNFGDGTTSTATNPTHNFIGPGVYRIKLFISDSLSCNAIDSITKLLVVLSNSTSSLDTIAVCDAASVQIGLPPSGDTLVTYNWTPATGLSQPTAPNPIANVSSSISYTLLVSNGVCTDTFFQEVQVLRDTLDLMPSQVIICPGDTVNIVVNNTLAGNNLTYEWSPASSIISGANTSSPFASISSSTSFSVTASNSLGCEYEGSVGIAVFPKPVQTSASVRTACPGDTIQLQVDTLIGGQLITYDWQPTASLIDPASDKPSIIAVQDLMVFLQYTNSSSCLFIDSTRVQILDGTAGFLPDRTLCDSLGVLIGPMSPIDSSLLYSWSPVNGLNQSNSAVATANPSSETLYTLVISNGNCEDTLRQLVRVFDNAVTLAADSLVCQGNVFPMQASVSDPGQIIDYTWTPASAILTGQGSPDVVLQLQSSDWVAVTVSNGLGCFYSDSVFISVSNNIPNVTASINPDTVNFGETAVLTAVSNQSVSYSWQPSASLSNPDSSVTMAQPQSTTWYVVTVVNADGCSNIDSVLLTLKSDECGDPYIFVPNAFSPNNDGKNDLLFVRGDNITDMYFAIFDRWGEKVFETTDQTNAWNGIYQGSALDPAVFAFYLEVVCDNGEEYKHKGNITLLR